MFFESKTTTLQAVVSTHNPTISFLFTFRPVYAADVTLLHASPKQDHQSSGFCSAHPTCGYVVGYGTAAVPINSPCNENNPTRALSVPRSMPITYWGSIALCTLIIRNRKGNNKIYEMVCDFIIGQSSRKPFLLHLYVVHTD